MYNHDKTFPSDRLPLTQTDADFIERFDHFVLHEVANQDDLDDRTRMMAIVATLIGCQGIDEFQVILPVALHAGVTAVEVKEIVYQSVAYLGIGRVLPFLYATNDMLTAQGVELPLPSQSTTTIANRLTAGIQAQVDIFGNQMQDFWKSGAEETRHINEWLAANCFGDYYTRTGLDHLQREMITFCFLSAQGGCEPQLTSHAVANIRLGQDKHFLIKIISQCLPYIGYPRSLNALRCVEEAAQQSK
ncbi:carboxymuconolactone decarboxylase family protein [Paenibacillus kyungheensis]